MDVGQLQELLKGAGQSDASDVQLIDVREECEHEIASLPGFQLLPLSRCACVLSSLPGLHFAKTSPCGRSCDRSLLGVCAMLQVPGMGTHCAGDVGPSKGNSSALSSRSAVDESRSVLSISGSLSCTDDPFSCKLKIPLWQQP